MVLLVFRMKSVVWTRPQLSNLMTTKLSCAEAKDQTCVSVLASELVFFSIGSHFGKLQMKYVSPLVCANLF